VCSTGANEDATSSLAELSAHYRVVETTLGFQMKKIAAIMRRLLFDYHERLGTTSVATFPMPSHTSTR
jgi:hypothetical protein